VVISLVTLSLNAQYQSNNQSTLSSNNKKAVKIYKDVLKKFTIKEEIVKGMTKVINIDRQFAEAYWVIAKYSEDKKSVDILQLALKNNAHRQDETLIKLVNLLFKMRKLQEALDATTKLSDNQSYKKIMQNKIEASIQLLKDTVPFNPQNLTYVNSNFDEYFPSVTADDKILSVTVSQAYGSFDNQEHMAYSRQINGVWLPFNPIDELNTNDNEGSQTISADGRYMFFTGCNRPDGLGSCDIYYSIYSNGKWGNSINPNYPLNTNAWESTPSLSPTGDELFFATNRGNSKKSDIWHCKVKILENGMLQFSYPEPLSEHINTDGNEYAPYIHSDNQTLYFISDGHIGFGGSDIFISRKDKNGEWSEAKNLGYPINTKDNVYGFTLTGEGNKGYISLKNTEKPERGLDIYEFELYPAIRPKSMTYITGSVYDINTKKPLAATIETFDFDSQKTIAESVSDNQTGEFTTFVPDTGQYGLNIRKAGYLFYSAKLEKSDEKLAVYLHPIKVGEKFILNNIFFAFNSSELEAKSEKEISKLVDLLTKNPKIKIKITGHTDNIGNDNFNKKLSEERAISVVNALINNGVLKERLSYKGMGATQPIANNDTDEGRAINRRVECEVE
jgi:outer membrane protein OmpA-like peptidoglycan-associated protein